jgi:hypothetical protein
MFQPYTYYIYHVPTGKKYYGCEHKKTAHSSNLWTKYFSSSKIVHRLLEQYGPDSFQTQVRKIFSSAKEALSYEDRFLRKVHAVEKDDWLNQAYVCGPSHCNWSGRTHSQKVKDDAKRRKTDWWKSLSEIERQHISNSWCGSGNSRFGKPFTEKWKQEQSERTRAAWTDDRKVTRSCQMKEFWKLRKLRGVVGRLG